MGDRDTTGRLSGVIEANTAGLLGYFYRRVEVPEDAADLLSDTFLAMWRREANVPDDETEARMWAYGVARNVLSTYRRSSRRRSVLHMKLRSELGAAEKRTESPDTDTLGLRSALTRLDPTDQEIIRLTYWDGFTQVEAAQLLGMPEGTVRSRHHRARRQLRKLLTQGGPATAPESLVRRPEPSGGVS